MKLVEEILKNIGQTYQLKMVDKGPAIYRKLDNGYEFEVDVISKKKSTLYVWKEAPHVLVGIYENIPTDSLMDVLGYYAVKYQNLSDKIQVEREDQIE